MGFEMDKLWFGAAVFRGRAEVRKKNFPVNRKHIRKNGNPSRKCDAVQCQDIRSRKCEFELSKGDARKNFRKTETEPLRHETHLDMTNSRSCQHSMSLPVMFWTSVLLLLLARGVYCTEEQQSKFDRFSKFEPEAEVEGYSTPDTQETYNVMNILRDLIQKHQQRGTQQLQVYNNGEDLSENQPDWRKVPLPLLYQIRAIINDGKEKDKRGSYMLPCHFKVCNLG